MTKPVFQDLVDQQIAVLRTTSILVICFMPSFLLALYYGFGITEKLPAIILSYVAIVLVNILLLFLHKNAVITYLVLITSTYAEIVGLTLVTGGILSPMVFILVILPVFAFYTSRKQGRFWFVVCFLSAVLLYNTNYFHIPVTNVVPDKYHALLLFIIVLFVTVLTSLYLNLVKQDVSRAHKSINTANKSLEEKSKRMENLILLVNYCTELMCVIDIKTLTFDEVNPVFKLLLGYELSLLRGEPVSKILKDEVLPLLSAATEDEVISFSSGVLCRNGEEKFFSWSAVAKNGKLYAYATGGVA